MFSDREPATQQNLKGLQKVSTASCAKIESYLGGKIYKRFFNSSDGNFLNQIFCPELQRSWSKDVAYVDKLANYFIGLNYLLVSVHVLSRYLECSQCQKKRS